MPKDRKHLTTSEIDKQTFSHIKFNFSFVSNTNGLGWDVLTEDDRVALIARIRVLSAENFLSVMRYPKNIGMELIPVSQMRRNCEVCREFFNAPHRDKLLQEDSRYYIFRLYTNDNPRILRIIGTMYRTIFYVLFYDNNGTMYHH